ncbi:DUF418 domain-containing protein [Actinomyces sp. B33]|uniref:DUF418 domain-containing protein n=1 Tax=Actinomyces sp. B33 TaxID=2942131 RepID=UPI0023410CF9|nr:DUF418 domain-containing protein [Actinomyces sp. B33]MDC4232259.1 DUF418 domain-containing protein [Actinomyces sp. B33]
MSYLSFTGPSSVRYPAPDVARGFMLLLIALANVPLWVALLPDSVDPTTADHWWFGIRAALVDRRAYPLFSLLFGFGLMLMVTRRIERDVEAALAAVDPAESAQWPDDVRAQWEAAVRAEAEDDARRLVRRRGWWMIFFGAVHALVFAGDIIGAYGLVAVLFAGLMTRRRWGWMTVVGIVVAVISMLMLYSKGYFLYSGIAEGLGIDPSTLSASSSNLTVTWYFPLVSLGIWSVSTVMTVLTSLVVPAVFIGARVACSDLLSRPDLHRGLLAGLGVGGLGVGVVGAIPYAMAHAGALDGPLAIAGPILFHASGLVGACAWLALLALVAGPGGAPLTGMRRVLASVGTRSMTAYIAQTVCFAVIFAGLGLAGVTAIHSTTGGLIGLGVWAATVVLCVSMDARGRQRGPLEQLLRRAVANTARPRTPVPLPVRL